MPRNFLIPARGPSGENSFARLPRFLEKNLGNVNFFSRAGQETSGKHQTPHPGRCPPLRRPVFFRIPGKTPFNGGKSPKGPPAPPPNFFLRISNCTPPPPVFGNPMLSSESPGPEQFLSPRSPLFEAKRFWPGKKTFCRNTKSEIPFCPPFREERKTLRVVWGGIPIRKTWERKNQEKSLFP